MACCGKQNEDGNSLKEDLKKKLLDQLQIIYPDAEVERKGDRYLIRTAEESLDLWSGDLAN